MPDDSQLLLDYARGGRLESLAALVDRHSKWLVAFLRGLLPTEADAEDAAQETWLRVIRFGETYRGGDEGDLVRVLGSLLPRLKALKAGSRRLAEAEFDASRIYAAYVKRVSSLAGCPRPENGQARSGLITNRERRRLTADARKG